MKKDVSDLIALRWRKAARSLTNGECVEVARAGGWIAVRDSKNPGGEVLSYSEKAWRGFVTGTRGY